MTGCNIPLSLLSDENNHADKSDKDEIFQDLSTAQKADKHFQKSIINDECSSKNNSEHIETDVDSIDLALECEEELLSPAQTQAHAKEWMEYLTSREAICSLPWCSASLSPYTGVTSSDMSNLTLPLIIHSPLQLYQSNIALKSNNTITFPPSSIPQFLKTVPYSKPISSSAAEDRTPLLIPNKISENLPIIAGHPVSTSENKILPVIIKTINKISLKDDVNQISAVLPSVTLNKEPKSRNHEVALENSCNAGMTGQSEQDKKLHTKSTLPKTATKTSIFCLQKSIPVVASGKQNVNILNILNIRPNMSSTRFEEAELLRFKLRQEKYITSPIKWLFEKRYVHQTSACSICGEKSFTIQEDERYFDGYCLLCDNPRCDFKGSIVRPKFFQNFPNLTLKELLLLTYHWVCQSYLVDIVKDVHLTHEKILIYFQALQKLCGETVEANGMLGGTTFYSKIETSVVKVGNFFILGAYDRKSHHTRLETLTLEEAFNTTHHIDLLRKWVNKNNILISGEKINEYLLPNVQTSASNPTILDCKNPSDHTLNVSKYLGKNSIALFGNLCHGELDKNLIQGFLNELQWRSRYGEFLEMAFWNIFKEISKSNCSSSGLVAFGKLDIDSVNQMKDLENRWGSIRPNEKVPLGINALKGVNPQFEMSSENTIPRDVEQTYLPSYSAIHIHDSFHSDEKQEELQDDLISSLWQKSVVTILGGTLESTVDNLLSVKIFFDDSPDAVEKYKLQALKLGAQLMKEGFLSSPVRWLVKRGYVDMSSPCYVCKTVSFLKDSNKFTDGCCWCCQNKNCRFENQFKRPEFFTQFGFQIKYILRIIYHWAIQSDIKTIESEIPLDFYKIICVQRKLQELCSVAVKRQPYTLGGQNNVVEVALLKYGNIFILAALDRVTKWSSLRAFHSDQKLHIDAIRVTLLTWIRSKSYVVINKDMYFDPMGRLKIVFADETITEALNPNYHVLNVTNYVTKCITSMFGHLIPNFNVELLQLYLNELMWRERFGKLPNVAFWNIMREVSALGRRDNTELAKNGKYNVSTNIHQFREVQVVLKRLSSKVLKKYNCSVFPVQPEKGSCLLQNKDNAVQEKISQPEDKSNYQANTVFHNSDMNSICSSSNSHDIFYGSPVQYNISNTRTIKLNSTSNQTSFKLPKTYSHSGSYAKTNDKFPVKSKTDGKLFSSKELMPTEFKCMECRSIVTVDHFMKQYTCGNCKVSAFSTRCPKSFFAHRQYLFFGKEVPLPDKTNLQSRHNITLDEFWYCCCGFSSKEGNKLASHLISCQKTTCYSHAYNYSTENPSSQFAAQLNVQPTLVSLEFDVEQSPVSPLYGDMDPS